jgi:hypothetical protein
MKEPGLYNGMIYGTRNDKANTPEFEMMATVVIPYEFNSTNKYEMNWQNEKLAPGMLRRYFLNVPAGASNLRIKIASGLNKYTSVRYYLHDQDGREKSFGICNISYSDEFYEKQIYPLQPGVYELVVLGNYNSTDTSYYNLLVDFDGLNRTDNATINIGSNRIAITNVFNEIKYYSVAGEIHGYQKDFDIKVGGVRHYDIPFTLNKREYLKKFIVSMSKEDFNKTTDYTLIVLDENGREEEVKAFSYFEEAISVTNSSLNTEKKYTLKIVPGLTNEDDNVNLHIREQTFVEKPQSIRMRPSSISLYPTMEKQLSFDIEKPGFEKPDDSKYFGKIDFKSRTGIENEMPLIINNGEAK